MRDKETNESDRDVASAVPAAALPGAAGSDISLMALDAAIAAARSRPAGKLFAVAAGEIKDLAGQTAEVADDEAARLSALPQGGAAG